MRCLVDTNLILRFLTGEPKDLAERAREFFALNEAGKQHLVIVPLVVAEVIFVLSGKVYGYSRSQVAAAVYTFLQSPSLQVEKRDVLLLAIGIYRDCGLDFVDAFIAAEAQVAECAVASFDKAFRSIDGLILKNP